ncbi:aldehyde dehydrogenase [Actinophytocola sp. S1-96]|uniref:Aldehyde dehydrogenase n=1 Tax=Actinophytocola gossypii TaxID=2812003 RepID=A0ABT2J7A0_9PSEU|nr:aldehyde dehydrogenase [Actinophytocola gossypii]
MTATETATQTIDITDPATGDPVGRFTPATPSQADSAVATARAALVDWRRTPAAERGAALRSAAAALRAGTPELAEIHQRETGRPRDEAVEAIGAGVSTLEQYAELGPVHRGHSLHGAWSATDLMIPEPRGVVVALTPWNDPVAVACGLLGAALVTGNTVVHKPSERCPHTGRRLGELLAESFPDGVLTTLTGAGETGAHLAGHHDVDVVAHVGGVATGRKIAEATARTGAKTLLENGGNDPLLVDGDVDPRWAAEQAALGAFANAGQVCVSVERIYVHQRIATPFLDALAAAAERWSHRLPPLVDRAHRDAVHEHVRQAVDAGAEPLAGGLVPDGPGAWYPATVLSGCTHEMPVLTEETFGPVAPVAVVRDFDEGLVAAASGRYGLAATVLTSDLAHAHEAYRALPVGTVKVNDVFGGAPGGAAQPRGASGTGFGYGPELLDELTTTKVVHLTAPGSA